MKKRPVILVADRNPRIRNFVRRELRSDGHHVLTAENAQELRHWIGRPERLDALVIDPNMPGLDGDTDLLHLFSPQPELAVVFHCQIWDEPGLVTRRPQWVFVEKTGHSVDTVRHQVMQLLNRP